MESCWLPPRQTMSLWSSAERTLLPDMIAPQISLGSSFWLPSFRMYRVQESRGDLMLRLILSTWLHTLDAIVVSAFARGCVILALLAFCVPGSSAQGGASKLRVATRVVPPMVIE